MTAFGSIRLAATTGIVVACGLAAGCASPGPAPKSSGPLAPGVVSTQSTSAAGHNIAGPVSSAPPVSAAGTRRAGWRGVVLLGGWAPGGAGNPFEAGALAYFSWLNARGGVYGRAISYRVLDDHGNSRSVPSLLHQLVQGDAVFALFGVVGDQNDGTVQFLDQAGVPYVFSGTPCSCVTGSVGPQEVFGWPLGSLREAKILGAWAGQRYRAQRIAVVYERDKAGRIGAAEFMEESQVAIAAKASIASSASARPIVAAVKAAHGKAIFAFTSPMITQSLKTAMRAAHFQVPLIAIGSGVADGLPDGVITDGFLPSVYAPARSAAASWITLFRKIRASYTPHAPFSESLINGMSAAYEMAEAMFRAGQSLTRPGLVAAMDGMPPGPAIAPLTYTAIDHTGIEGAYIALVRDGNLAPLTDVLITDNAAASPVTSYAYPQQQAPADGVPAH